jgi:two-component system, cell cycle response regulator
MVLNFASNLISHISNQKLMVEFALETIADFSKADRTALFSYNEETDILCLEGVFVDGRVLRHPASLSLKGSSLEDVFDGDCCIKYENHQRLFRDVFRPIWGECTGKCFFMPAVSTKNRRMGVVVFYLDKAREIAFENVQYLRQFVTVLAIAMENSRLFDLAVIDGLTELYVRRYYDLRIVEELAKLKRGGKGSLGLVLIDVDNFKSVNDDFGHQVGDRLLAEFARIIRKNIRQNVDIPCRYGGEEFVILMPGASHSQAAESVYRLKKICTSHDFGIKDRIFSFSAGVAACSAPDVPPPESLLKQADIRLYQAKSSGKNQIVWKD